MLHEGRGRSSGPAGRSRCRRSPSAEEHDVVVATGLLDPPTAHPDVVRVGMTKRGSSRTTRPFTVTAPSRTSSSLARREATPASAGTLWIRIRRPSEDFPPSRRQHSDHSTGSVIPSGPGPETPPMLQSIRNAIDWLKLAITEPIGQLTTMQASIRRWFEVLRYCAGFQGGPGPGSRRRPRLPGPLRARPGPRRDHRGQPKRPPRRASPGSSARSSISWVSAR